MHEIVGRINGHYGTLTHVPIHHLDRQLSFHELCALYAITDVALVTSLRDGMNLVSYEYVACQSDNAGVLVWRRTLNLKSSPFIKLYVLFGCCLLGTCGCMSSHTCL